MNNYIKIGKIVSLHGIRGEVKIYPYTDDPHKFKTFENLFYENRDGGLEGLKILGARIHKNMPLILFEGHDRIEKGEYLIDKFVFVPREYVDDGDGHFIVDLLGSRIEDEDGFLIGTLKDVLPRSHHDLYEIEHAVTGKLCYIPVAGEFVVSVDAAEKLIVIRPIPGLLDDYRGGSGDA